MLLLLEPTSAVNKDAVSDTDCRRAVAAPVRVRGLGWATTPLITKPSRAALARGKGQPF